MYLLFVDESGKPDERAFAVGGVVVRMDEWNVLRERWRAVLDRHDWPAGKEVKYHLMRTGMVPPALADDLFGTLAGAPITCYAVVVKALAARQRRPDLFGTPEDAYAESLTWLAERFERFLARADSYGTIVVDSRKPDLDDKLRRYFDRLAHEGTPYSPLERLVDALLLGPSHHSLGLQVADLVVGTALAAQRDVGDASRWHKQLLPRFARHPDTGALAGVGLVVYPRGQSGEEPPPSKLFAG